MRHITAMLAAVLVAVGTLGGCATGLREPDSATALSGRSLATDSPRLRQAERQAGLAGYDGLVWYDYRNDIQPSVAAGYFGPVYEFNATITHDRQTSYDGRVRDHYHQRTIRGRIQHSVR